jgi:hypothetical protein
MDTEENIINLKEANFAIFISHRALNATVKGAVTQDVYFEKEQDGSGLVTNDICCLKEVHR